MQIKGFVKDVIVTECFQASFSAGSPRVLTYAQSDLMIQTVKQTVGFFQKAHQKKIMADVRVWTRESISVNIWSGIS